jgi:hypothetical protein
MSDRRAAVSYRVVNVSAGPKPAHYGPSRKRFSYRENKTRVMYVGSSKRMWPAHPLAHPVEWEKFEGDRAAYLTVYREWLLSRPDLGDQLEALRVDSWDRALPLGCWCHPEPCHADVLAALMNGLAPQLGPRRTVDQIQAEVRSKLDQTLSEMEQLKQEVARWASVSYWTPVKGKVPHGKELVRRVPLKEALQLLGVTPEYFHRKQKRLFTDIRGEDEYGGKQFVLEDELAVFLTGGPTALAHLRGEKNRTGEPAVPPWERKRRTW